MRIEIPSLSSLFFFPPPLVERRDRRLITRERLFINRTSMFSNITSSRSFSDHRNICFSLDFNLDLMFFFSFSMVYDYTILITDRLIKL